MRRDRIENSEELYRAVPSRPSHFVNSNGRITSAVFKDKKGLSVDRGGGRSDQDMIDLIERERSPDHGLVKIGASKVWACETHPMPDELDGNQYHAMILRSPDDLTKIQSRRNDPESKEPWRYSLSSREAYCLVDACEMVKLPSANDAKIN